MAAIHSLAVPLLLLASSLVSAIPNVTPIALGSNDCSEYPHYIGSPGRDMTEPFTFVPDQADNSNINGLRTYLSSNRLIISTNPEVAIELFSCTNSNLADWSGPPAGETLLFTTDSNDESFGYGTAGVKPGPYAHEIAGVRQDGVFLGAQNITTWAFKFVPSNGGAGSVDSYQMRLLAPNDATGDGEVEGFVKIVSF